MNTNSMFSFLDVIVIGAGIYILYGWYVLVKNNEIKQGLIVSKATDPSKCKDIEGFKKYIGPRLLIFALCAILSGGFGLLQTYVVSMPGVVYWVFYFLFLAVVIWFGVAAKKAEKRFF